MIKHLMLAMSLTVLPAAGSAQVMIGSTGGTGDSPSLPGAIVQLDPSDASAVVLDTPFDGLGISGIEQAPDGTVYAVSSVRRDGAAHLLVIDPTSGGLVADLGQLLDSSGNGCAINDLATHPTTGVLYAMAANNSGVGTRCGVGGSTGGYLLTIDPVAVEYTVIGRESTLGNNSGGIAFDESGTLYFTPGWNTVGTLHTLDLSDGSFTSTVELSEDFGFHGLEIDPNTGTLYASLPMTDDCCYAANRNIYTIDTGTGAVTLVGSPGDYSVHDMVFIGEATLDRAIFRVTKTFSDGSTDDVDVTLTCNTGLPLTQDFTIAGGDEDGVAFVVNELGAGATCEVTESGGPDGYTTVMNGGDGCTWEGVTGGFFVCEIENIADPAIYTVSKNWTVYREGGDAVINEAHVTVACDSYFDGGWEDDGMWYMDIKLFGNQGVIIAVDVTDGPATCSTTESITQSGVESSADGCGEVTLSAGDWHSCTFTNTVFFEGIPTLSQYGLALLVLLTLGVGFVGLRRFV